MLYFYIHRLLIQSDWSFNVIKPVRLSLTATLSVSCSPAVLGAAEEAGGKAGVRTAAGWRAEGPEEVGGCRSARRRCRARPGPARTGPCKEGGPQAGGEAGVGQAGGPLPEPGGRPPAPRAGAEGSGVPSEAGLLVALLLMLFCLKHYVLNHVL